MVGVTMMVHAQAVVKCSWITPRGHNEHLETVLARHGDIGHKASLCPISIVCPDLVGVI
jgi:hypothetical protein